MLVFMINIPPTPWGFLNSLSGNPRVQDLGWKRDRQEQLVFIWLYMAREFSRSSCVYGCRRSPTASKMQPKKERDYFFIFFGDGRRSVDLIDTGNHLEYLRQRSIVKNGRLLIFETLFLIPIYVELSASNSPNFLLNYPSLCWLVVNKLPRVFFPMLIIE